MVNSFLEKIDSISKVEIPNFFCKFEKGSVLFPSTSKPKCFIEFDV